MCSSPRLDWGYGMTQRIETLIEAANARRLLGEKARLELEVRRLRMVNTRLQNRLREKSQRSKLIDQARIDADFILALHYAGLPVSRSYCMEAGLPRRRWQRARKLLRVAGVMNTYRVLNLPQTSIVDELNAAYQQAKTAPKAFLTRPVGVLRTGTLSAQKRTQKQGTLLRKNVPHSASSGVLDIASGRGMGD